MTPWLFGAAGVAAVFVLVGSPHAGQPGRAHDDPARLHFDRGVQLLDTRDFSSAIGELEESLRLRRTAAALLNLGIAYRGAFRYREARDALRGYLEEFEDQASGRRRIEVEMLLREIQSFIVAVPLRVTFQGPVKGATVRVDGSGIGTTPLSAPIELGVGRHTVEVAMKGFKTATVDLNVTAASSVGIEIKLDPLEPPATLLRVVADLPTAEIRIDGVRVGFGAHAAAVTPGAHGVDVVAEGYFGEQRRVTLGPGETARLDVRLKAVPEPSLLSRWWFWVAVFGAVAVGGGATYAALRSPDVPAGTVGTAVLP